MTKQNIGFYCAIIKELAPDVLEMVENTFATSFRDLVANENDDVVAKNATAVAIDWKFRWFRHITPLPYRYQCQIVNNTMMTATKGGKN